MSRIDGRIRKMLLDSFRERYGLRLQACQIEQWCRSYVRHLKLEESQVSATVKNEALLLELLLKHRTGRITEEEVSRQFFSSLEQQGLGPRLSAWADDDDRAAYIRKMLAVYTTANSLEAQLKRLREVSPDVYLFGKEAEASLLWAIAMTTLYPEAHVPSILCDKPIDTSGLAAEIAMLSSVYQRDLFAQGNITISDPAVSEEYSQWLLRKVAAAHPASATSTSGITPPLH